MNETNEAPPEGFEPQVPLGPGQAPGVQERPVDLIAAAEAEADDVSEADGAADDDDDDAAEEVT